MWFDPVHSRKTDRGDLELTCSMASFPQPEKELPVLIEDEDADANAGYCHRFVMNIVGWRHENVELQVTIFYNQASS